MPARVRRFAPRDTDAVVALWETCFPDDPARNEPRGVIQRKLARDPDLFWVATDGDAVVGALLGGYDGYRGWLYHLAVDPGRRREGIARMLVERAVAELEILGCVKVNLQVRRSNEAVLAVYDAVGFEEFDAFNLGRVIGE
ncbi:GNAT family acetyltransferase [Demequina sp. NBRC 110055]|uniref:GNAT family acetyltransferase n=1 Tax=Demequina sp. NBRC 110055 TaxID=1570344 RepID=UPI000A065A2B|nr:GNAT family acetyltransferase [Demequina sp. NBRC 110055]